MNMEDIFSQFGDIFGGGNPFESFFGGGGGGRGGGLAEASGSVAAGRGTLAGRGVGPAAG